MLRQAMAGVKPLQKRTIARDKRPVNPNAIYAKLRRSDMPYIYKQDE